MSTHSTSSSDVRLGELEAENARLRQELADARAARSPLKEAVTDGEFTFHAIADSIDQMIWTTLADGYHDYFNRRWYEFTGMPDGSTDGEEWSDMFHPDDQERAWAIWRHCLETGDLYHIEYRLRHRTGEYRWVLGRAQPVRNAAGEIVRWYGTCTDIHDFRMAQNALHESEGRYRTLFEAIDAGFCIFEMKYDEAGNPVDFRFVEINPAFERQSGIKNAAGQWITSLVPNYEQHRLEIYGRVARSRQPVRFEDYSKSLDRWFDVYAYPVDAPERHRVAALFTDISSRRRAEEALREERNALEILNTTASRVAAELDLDSLVQTVVDAGVELTGAQFGAFFYNVLDDDGASYMLYALAGAERGQFDFGMPRATAVFAPTFKGEGVIRSADITADPRYGKNGPDHGMPIGHLPVRSYLAVPVVSRNGEVIGGLFFGHEETGVFSERSERLMSGLAAQAAIGIDNARLFNATQRANRTLEAQVEQRTADRNRMWNLTTDIMLVADFEAKIESTNPAWTTALGWADGELIGKPFLDFVHPDDVERTVAEVGALSDGRKTLRFENRYRHRDGSYRWLSWTAVPDVGLIHAVGRDVTAEKLAAAELEHAQEALRQAQKMETLGQLTGGVAHDFNNLLQIVTGNLEILQRNLPPDQARLRRSAENAMKGAERASILTQRLLAFSRRQPLEPKPVSLNKLVGGMSELLHRTLGETIEVETVLASGLWSVEADPNQLENALLNLAVNARDAMPGGGKLTIETSNTHLDRSYVAQNSEIAPGQYVVICVSDTGAGMSPETLARVFEPFFTTKDVGKGTGLGLSMVYGFVKQSGGHVNIYSEVGEGTTVKIYLPRLRGEYAEQEQEAEVIVPEGTRGETILVCEDDDDVRAYSVEVLRELGYRVLEAHDGPSALRLLERQEGGVDLLFTDVVLPSGMMGDALAEQARTIRPGLKVLFTTGYARNAIVHHGRLDPGVELITKPFSYAELAARIRDLLDLGR